MEAQNKHCPRCGAVLGKSNSGMWHEEGEDCALQKAPVGRGGIAIGTQEKLVKDLESGQSLTMKDALAKLNNKQ
jgi:hypothetical protein